MRPERDEIIDAYTGGASIREVAEMLDTTRHQVRMALVEGGVQRRPAHRPLRDVPEDLGQVPDREIAEREGVTVQSVQYLRYTQPARERARREGMTLDEALRLEDAANDLDDPRGPDLPDSMYEAE